VRLAFLQLLFGARKSSRKIRGIDARTRCVAAAFAIGYSKIDLPRKLRANFGRFADLWKGGEVKLQGAALLANPNFLRPALKVKGNLFIDLNGGV
jgi:hypothetical protein